MNKDSYTWDEEKGIATYIINYKGMEFGESAFCHPDDQDMKSKLIGLHIAEARASLLYLRYRRDNELRPQLESLKQLYYSMSHSAQFNPKSYEAKMLFKQINRITKELKTTKKAISYIKEGLFQYMREKDEYHEYVRRKRANGQEGLIT